MNLERLWYAIILVSAGWDYEDVPFNEVMTRGRYKFLRDRLENAAKALLPEEVGTWIEASERLPKLGELVVIWDADWRDQFIKRIKDGMAWDTKRYTHWHPCSREPQPQRQEGK